MQTKALTDAWIVSGFIQDMSLKLVEHAAKLHAHEMWRLAASMAGSKSVPPSILFGRQNGDGLRRASGPGSFEAAYQAAKERAREASQE